MEIALGDINYLAVLAAIVLNMAAGALWYSPLLFAKPWMALNNLTEETIKEKGSAAPRYIVIVRFIARWLAAIVIGFAISKMAAAAGAGGVAEFAIYWAVAFVCVTAPGYIVAIAASIVIAFAITLLADAAGVGNAAEGALLGAVVGGFVAAAFASSYAFESKRVKHYLINAGYPVVALTLVGTLIGGWQ